MDFDDIKKDLNERYPNIDVISLTDEGPGKVGMELGVGAKELAYLSNDTRYGPVFHKAPGYERASNVIRRRELDQSDLDLAEPSVLSAKPHKLFERSINYYKKEDLYGSVVRLLANFASNGFENDIDNDDIKLFFDNWAMDIGLDSTVENIFFDLVRVGIVRTYKTVGKYRPQINTLDTPSLVKSKVRKDTAAKKIRWSKNDLPIHYTILNPLQFEIAGSLMFNQTLVTLKPEALSDLKMMLETNKSELTEHQKLILKSIPNDMKKAAIAGKPYPLNPYLVGEVDYRRMPYERYPTPRGTNAFESIDYKRELRKADYSTLDGISNYILKVTIGNDNFPVTKPEMLENIAEIFNTPAKSYNIIYNHTLDVQKIVSPEIGEILGQDKYAQVNEDYTGALGVVRALIDGVGNINTGAADLAIKGVIAEVSYLRNQVRKWLYTEYRDVAEAMGFDKYPTVRFNDIALRDEVEMMRVIQGLIDRRIMSYETGTKRLGLDWNTELKRLSTEKGMVLSGDLGIIGSPYNPKATPPMVNDENVQETQRTPSGTPSEGRPVGGGEGEGKEKSSLAPIITVGKIHEDISKLSKAEKAKLLERLQDED